MLLLLAACCWFSPTTQAEDEFDDFNTLCDLSPAECLKQVKTKLADTSLANVERYRLVYFQLDSLITLKLFDELNLELEKWIEVEEVPVVLRLMVLTTYAKMRFVEQDIEKGKQFLEKALMLSKQINDAFPKPTLLLQIANLQMYTEDYDTAIATLDTINQRFGHRNEPGLMLSVYGNKGHIYNLTGQYQQSSYQWHRALKWALEQDNKQQIAVVHYNLADVQERLELINDAKDNYEKALLFAIQAQDKVNQMRALLRLAAISASQNNDSQAQHYFSQVDITLIPPFEQEFVEKLINRFPKSSTSKVAQ